MRVIQTMWDFFQGQILGMKWLNDLIGMGLSSLGLDLTNRWVGSILFFIYDVIVVLLGLVARGGNVFWGILLLLLYSVGHSVLVLVAGTSIGFVKKLTASEKYGAFSKWLKYLMGTAILLIGFYMFYLGF